jgi:hypothetical protein
MAPKKKAARKPAARRPEKSEKALRAGSPVSAVKPGGGKAGLIVLGLVVVLGALLAETYYQAQRQAKMKFDMIRVGRIIPQGHDKGQGTGVVELEGDKADNLWFLEGDGTPPRLQKFDPSGEVLAVYQPKRPDELLTGPVDLTTDSSGNVYVLLQDRIQKISPEAKYLGSMKINIPGPAGLGLDSKGTFYVISNPMNKVVMLGADGKVQGEFGAPGSNSGDLATPVHLRVSSDDQAVILEQRPTGLRVKVFAPDHKLKREFDVENLQFAPPLKMGVNGNGKVFFNDSVGSRGMVVYDINSGKFVGDAQATKDGEKFIFPGAIGANKWTPTVYLHTVPGLIKCLLPNGGGAQ